MCGHKDDPMYDLLYMGERFFLTFMSLQVLLTQGVFDGQVGEEGLVLLL